MTEIALSARIPRALEKELLDYMKVEHLERSAAIRKLLFGSLQDWKEKYALVLLEQGKTTVSRAAQIAGLDIWEFVEKIKKAKTRWVSEEIIKRDLEAFR